MANLAEKDKLEKEFYDIEAQRYLDDFQKSVFQYDPHEPMPVSHQYFYSQLENIQGKKILDMGCGYGFTSVTLAKREGQITSIDISPKMIALTKRNAEFNNVNNSINAFVMSAQSLEFDDNSFDFVVGLGILHHLNLELAGKEISRVLEPGGQAIFIEPRIPFKFLIFFRSVFPVKCFESPGGSQITDKEIKRFSAYFSSSQIEYFLFLNKFSRLSFIKRIDAQLENFDFYLVKKYPFLRKLYWAFVVKVNK